jgi:hypothetical protein
MKERTSARVGLRMFTPSETGIIGSEMFLILMFHYLT